MKRFITFLALFFAACALFAQGEKRVALVIGNSRYANNPLANPANDAHSMANALASVGFDVTEKHNLSFDAFNNAVTEFARTIKGPNTVALFYYAGHGVQYNGQNYLVPVDADNITVEGDIEWRCIPLDRIISKMQDAKNRLNIVVLDACRTFRIARGARRLQNGLVPTEANIPELLIAYATAPGTTADDNAGGSNGLFTESLLKYLLVPGSEVRDVFFETRREVKEKSSGRQTPSVTDNLTRKFFFSPASQGTADRDKDGVPDAIDRCPDAKGPKNLQGCPDRDKDGVIDILDNCPLVAGPPANKGCPLSGSSPQAASETEHCLGITYGYFGLKGETLTTAGTVTWAYRNHAAMAHYLLVKKVGGFASLGYDRRIYTSSFGDRYTGDYVYLGIGPGVRILNRSARLYVFSGINLSYDLSGDDALEFGFFEVFAICNLDKIGFKAGYINTLGGNDTDSMGGFSVGAHYIF